MAVCGAYQHTKAHTGLQTPQCHKYQLHISESKLRYPKLTPACWLPSLPLVSTIKTFPLSMQTMEKPRHQPLAPASMLSEPR